jgi:DNA-binding beta-propeller fold protein YncE
VSDENLAQVTVLRIQRQPSGAPGAVGIGRIAVDRGPVGFAFSPDGATLYLASEIGVRSGASFDASGQLTRPCPAGTAIGTLTAIDVARATVVARLAAGCSPVRVVVTANGATVWMSVRGEDRVVAFDAAKIRTDPTHAFAAQAAVGSAPVGMALLADDSLLAVANSNRFDTGSTASTVTVLQLGATPSPRSSFATGSFPREFSVSPNGSTLFLTNYNSRTVRDDRRRAALTRRKTFGLDCRAAALSLLRRAQERQTLGATVLRQAQDDTRFQDDTRLPYADNSAIPYVSIEPRLARLGDARDRLPANFSRASVVERA